jgi:hypothetical protein
MIPLAGPCERSARIPVPLVEEVVVIVVEVAGEERVSPQEGC